jgi:hypothetical protein
MISFNLDLAMDDEEYPGLSIAGEFGAVEQYLLLLSEYLPVVRDQTKLRSEAELRRRYPKHTRAELSDDYDQIDWVSKTLVPKFFLGSFVMASWAAFEISGNEIASYVRSKEDARLKLKDLRLPDGWEKLKLYFETIWDKDLVIQLPDRRCIDALHVVRNSFAHANGTLRFERDTNRLNEIRNLAQLSVWVSLVDDEVMVSEQFLRESFASLEAVINMLLDECSRRYASQAK